MNGKELLLASTWLLSVVLLPAGLAAQEEAAAFEISFANPGARSIGFGGAFVALADDATAAFSNPAGLVQLLRPEISLEGRVRGFTDLPVAFRSGPSTNISNVGFVSFVYPWKSFSLAVYRQSVANLETEFRFNGFLPGTGGSRLFWTDVAVADFTVENNGLSGSYRVSEKLSVGAGISFYEATFSYARLTSFFEEDNATASFSRLTSTGTTAELDLGFNVGFLWHPSKRWHLGGVWRHGPGFGLRREERAGFGDLAEAPVDVRRFDLEFPDVLGLGVAFKSKSERLILSFEWDQVRYSDTLNSVTDSRSRSGFGLDDADELHLGIEYVFTGTKPVIGLRLGAWLEPDHRLRFTGDDPIDRTVFQPGEDAEHFAWGLGFAFKRLKFDLGVDASDLVDTLSLSLIYTF